MAAIDLYSGIGGWRLGFQMAGIPVVASFEWWKDANLTHNKNFRSDHEETDIRLLQLQTLPAPGTIQYVVGSPPCTEFSFANRGGNGDIDDGLKDIVKFLEVVRYLQPRYWAMENVPRVAKIIEKYLRYGRLRPFKPLFEDIRIYNSADFGVPQDRNRMIAGRLPFDLLESYKQQIPQMNMGVVLNALREAPYIDPIYGIEVQAADLSDHVEEMALSDEEVRINQEAKNHHPVYNRMSFPDKQDRPSRTITALCTRVSRESIIIRDHKEHLRRLTVRERAAIQSFPFNYHFFGSTYANKLKMVGNAVPPLLTFYIAQSMQGVTPENLLSPRDVPRERLQLSQERAKDHIPDNVGAKYSWNRTFWLAIRGLRFGSGVRFDLKNLHFKNDKSTSWRIGFYYGPSKAIKEKKLDRAIFNRYLLVAELGESEMFRQLLDEYLTFITNVNATDLQKNWTNLDRNVMGPIILIDALAGFVLRFKERLEALSEEDLALVRTFVVKEFEKKEPAKKEIEKNGKGKSNKDRDNSELPKANDVALEIFIGVLMGASFNLIMQGEAVKLKGIKVRA